MIIFELFLRLLTSMKKVLKLIMLCQTILDSCYEGMVKQIKWLDCAKMQKEELSKIRSQQREKCSIVRR